METIHCITVTNNNGIERELTVALRTEEVVFYDDYNAYPQQDEQDITYVEYKGISIEDKLSYDYIDYLLEETLNQV